jgi:hypothetical protein
VNWLCQCERNSEYVAAVVDVKPALFRAVGMSSGTAPRRPRQFVSQSAQGRRRTAIAAVASFADNDRIHNCHCNFGALYDTDKVIVFSRSCLDNCYDGDRHSECSNKKGANEIPMRNARVGGMYHYGHSPEALPIALDTLTLAERTHGNENPGQCSV